MMVRPFVLFLTIAIFVWWTVMFFWGPKAVPVPSF
jgi:hypothetical protein